MLILGPWSSELLLFSVPSDIQQHFTEYLEAQEALIHPGAKLGSQKNLFSPSKALWPYTALALLL